MNKIFQIVIFLLFPLHIVFSQSDSQMFWNSVNELQIVTIGTRYIVPQAYYTCLLYTSDAADERSSVDLGGRRIIKKKKKKEKRGVGDSKRGND